MPPEKRWADPNLRPPTGPVGKTGGKGTRINYLGAIKTYIFEKKSRHLLNYYLCPKVYSSTDFCSCRRQLWNRFENGAG
jgi:hypothetical protein